MTEAVPDSQMNSFKTFAESLTALAVATVEAEIAGRSLEIKADGSPVTSVDLAVERALRARIEEAYPDHGILGEEFDDRNLDAEWIWVLDPIDGTRQFASGLSNYGVLIALCQQGQPLLGVICQPRIGDVYLGIAGQGAWLNGQAIQSRPTERIEQAIACFADPDSFRGGTLAGLESLRRRSDWNVYDGSCIGFGALAAGHLDLCLCSDNLDAFDICALVPVVEGAGGRISNWRGGPLTIASEGAIVASATPALHEEALALLAEAVPGEG